MLPMQMVFLDRLSARETTRLTERIIKYIVFKLIFVSAVVTPDLTEVTLWLAWWVTGTNRMCSAADCISSLANGSTACRWLHDNL